MEQVGNDKFLTVRKKERIMGVELVKIGVQIRKFVTFSIRTCYRSVCNHPFLVGMVLILFLLYRSFPFLFSLLVSASPVIVCTAVLLGTLLSFGQPNIPEIEKEEKTTHEADPLRTGFQRDATVVERDESFVVERYTVKRRDLGEKSIVEEASKADVVSETDKSDSILVYSPSPVGESSRELQLEKQVSEEAERELQDSGFETKSEMKEEKLDGELVLENQYSQIDKMEDENVELDHDKSSLVESIDSHMADRADSSPTSPWKQAEEDEEEVDDEASDSGSDRAESSSPDASMADIIPMLDELHPLLDEDVPQPTHMDHDGSDAGSERSHKSSDHTNESDEDSEHHEEEVGDDDDDDEEEEEERQGGKGDAIKSAITWTEDDQKNLMDLGTSELERNQRLESLIARRRARRMMTEKNLIDLDDIDLPFSVAPISTARRNPFDTAYDSNNNMGLPPIPGSAPSSLFARRNPFDLPYDSSEEKPDLTADNFQQEFMPFHPKEIFRRHESFSVGPSMFGPPKQEKQDIKLKPYFVPEQVVSEGASYSSFQRQSSELSDSKASSVPETESIGSAGDQDDKKLDEDDLSQEADSVSAVEHPSELVGHGSESSEDVDVIELGQSEKRDIEQDEVEIKFGDVGSHTETESFSETRDVAEYGAGEIHVNSKAEEVNYSSRSSSSSSTEVHERIFDEKEEVLSSLGPTEENDIGESTIIMQSTLEESDFDITSVMVDDNQHKEPVYDSSPPAIKKNFSSSSISSDLQGEVSKTIFTPVLIEGTVSADRESEESSRSIEMDTLNNKQISLDSSQVPPVDKGEQRTSGGTNTLLNHGLSSNDLKLDSSNASIVPEHPPINLKPSSDPEKVDIDVAMDSKNLTLTVSKVEHPSVTSNPVASSSEDEPVVEHPLEKEVPLQIQQDEVDSSSFDANSHVGINKEADEKLLPKHSESLSDGNPMLELEEQLPSSDKAMVESSPENQGELIEQSISLAESNVEGSATRNLDASEIQPRIEVSSESHSPSTIESASLLSEVFGTKLPSDSVHLKDKVLYGIENAEEIAVQPFDFSMEATDSQVHEQDIIEEADEMKEIDEGLLMELDTVGDFNVKSLGPNFNESESDRVSGGEMNSRMPLIEARTVADIDSIFNATDVVPPKTEFEIGELKIPHQDQVKEDTHSGMPVLEARSVEDIDTAFRQISEEFEKPVVIESLHADKLIPEKTDAGSSEYGIHPKETGLMETEIGLPVVEARSTEDIDFVFKQLHDVKRDIGPDVLESKDTAESYSELPIEKESKMESVDDGSNVVELKDSAEINPDSHVSEARSLEDFDVAPKLTSEVDVDKLVRSDFKDGPAESESNEGGPSTGINSGVEESSIQESSTSAVKQSDHGAQTTKGEHEKKAKTQKSNSSSSSSSSDSE